ncbi:MAG: S8 family serine peptidase [Verrucomicrobiia bacterium]
MRFESRTWFILSLLLFAAAIYFWRRGNEYQLRKHPSVPPASQQQAATNPAGALNATAPAPFKLLSQTANLPASPAGAIAATASSPSSPEASTNRFPLRLSNTERPLRELMRLETALLLRNASIDTAERVDLPIPEHLRAEGDPGSYIVQARGPVGQPFRDRLREVGAGMVSYLPNNAFLVQLSADGAARLAASPETQAVLPFEPYYKLDAKLLPKAVDQEPLETDEYLRVTAFPGQGEVLANSVLALGGEVLGEERSPFGPQLLVKPAPESLPEIARLASAHIVELYYKRELLTDLARVLTGVATSGTAETNYLDLTGANVMVNVNDGGVEGDHPDLVGRVFGDTPDATEDPFAHGTHVAGIIAGSGAQSDSVSVVPPGSETNALFRGIAPEAEIFSMPFQAFPEVNRFLNEEYLQETAARTNAVMSKRPNGPMISNNSWAYVGVNEYDSSSARFDEAVRDAVRDGTNSAGAQPMIFVFAAGNSGDGADQGEGGEANSIPSPANAKNVITVGALENFRYLTNAVLVTNELDGSVFTNTLFLGVTDSFDEVAAYSSRGNIGIGVEGEFGRFKPDVVAPGTFLLAPRASTWNLESEFDTNSAEYTILKELNDPLAPYYRYETGTSQAAPVVSGLLALMQEFFEQRLPLGLRQTNSPALMKALLINGSRSVNPLYSLQVQSSINYQGWGVPNLQNILSPMMLNRPQSEWPVRYFDQSPTNALATGESKSWTVNISTNAEFLPLRVTLVWTDPPGNPNAGIKLVNDLDLVVSNTVSGQVYYGNDIRADSDFTHGSAPEEASALDVVNNVENVFIREAGSTNFVVSVIARRVNVTANTAYNAATGEANDVVQDFALVIASGDSMATNAFSVAPLAPPPPITTEPVSMTNGLPLLNQRVGANPPLLNARHGLSNQWRFYVFTNLYITNDFTTMTNGTNVAFITFFPPNAAAPRNESADIDLYVSKDPGLVQLDRDTVDTAWQSATRGGTESVVFTNAALGDVFYIGVKSEDQQAGEYGLIALSSDQPFEEDQNGAKILNGMPVPQEIPDGTPSNPGRATVFAIGITPITVQKVVVTNQLTHQLVGDLSMILDHEQVSVVLHNHTLNNGFPNVTNAFFIYDDEGFGNTFGGRRSDGPGSLNDFAGLSGNGVWMFNVVDNAPNRTGRIEALTIRLDPFVNADLTAAGAEGISGTVGPNDTACFFVDVPPEATNLIVNISQITGPLEVYISHGSLPTDEIYDKSALINPPGGTITLGAEDEPVPLGVGRYFVCLHNPSTTASVDFRVAAIFELGVGLDFRRTLITTNALTLLDDGVIRSTVTVPVDKQVADVQVAVRIDHPRSSDLVLHLVSPQGTRLLLAENRGGSDSEGYGTGFGTNISYTIFTEDTNLLAGLAPIKFSLPPWTNFNISTNPPVFLESFETVVPGVYGGTNTNSTFVGWAVVRGEAEVHGPESALGITADTGTNFVELGASGRSAGIVTGTDLVSGKDYMLSFVYRRNPSADAAASQALQVYVGPPAVLRPPVKFIPVGAGGWQATNILFTVPAETNRVELALGALTGTGPLIDTIEINEVIVGTNIYVLPEESLDLLRGERVMGDWTLEVWDNRAGPVGERPGALLNWELQLEYGNPPGRAIRLTNGVAFNGTISGNQTNFFVVEVCDTSNVGFASLFGPFEAFFNEGRMQLLVDREGFPTGDAESDDFVPIRNDLPLDDDGERGAAAIQFTSDPHQPAPLIPGGRLFFAIHNLYPNETNDFQFQVSFDNDTCSGPPPITRLQDGVIVTNVVAPAGILFNYYVFNVSPIALEAQFEVVPRDGDVGLVLSYGLPAPDLVTFDYQSDRPGITNELIVLTNTSSPVALTPGDWYLGVYNNSTNATVYTVRASQVLDTNINLITLTNGIPRDFTLLQGSGLTNFFLLEVPDPYPGLRFELYNLSGDADLLIDFNALPSSTNYFLSNSASALQPVNVEVRTNAELPDLRGNWVMAVINKDLTNLLFTIRASFIEPETNAPPIGTNRVVENVDISVTDTNLCLSWPATVGLQYHIQAIEAIGDTNWQVIFGPETATATNMSHCISLPTRFGFFEVIELGGEQPPPPTEDRFLDPEVVSVTATNLCFEWPSTMGLQYRLEAKETLSDTNWQVVFGPQTATSSVMGHCIDLPTTFMFFQVVEIGGGEEPPPPAEDRFLDPEIVSVTATNLCFEWPSTMGLQYRLEAKETLSDTNWQVVFGPQTATSSVMGHCIDLPTTFMFFQVVEIGGGEEPPPPTEDRFLDPEIVSVTATNLCFEWPSTMGLQYRLEAKETLSDTNWQVVFGPQTATSSVMGHCIDLPTTFMFFQVVEIGGGEEPPPPTEDRFLDPEIVSVTATNLCFEWPSTMGLQYRLEAKETLSDTNWQVVFGPQTATSSVMGHCIDLPTTFMFFQVVEIGGGEEPPPPTEDRFLDPEIVSVTATNLCFEWVTTTGLQYRLEAKENLGQTNWQTVFGPQTASGPVMNHCINLPTPLMFFQVVELGGGGNGGTNEPPPTPGIRLLESGVAQSNSVAASVPDHYRFNVSPGAASVQFDATPVDGDISLVLRYGLPLPDGTGFDYRSDRVGVTNESLVITDISSPVFLQPGDWYLGILDKSSSAVRYTVRASEVIDTSINLLRLTNGIPRDFTLGPGAGLTNFFLFKALDPVPSVRLELFNLTGDADLLIGWDTLPSATAYYIRESADGAPRVEVELRTNTIADLRGNWVLAVLNQQTNDLSFTVRASVPGITNTPATGRDITLGTPAVLLDGRLQLTWDADPGVSYSIEFTTNLAPVINWTLLTNLVTTSGTATFVDPGGVTNGPMRFYRVRER